MTFALLISVALNGEVGPVPKSLGLDPFYKKYLSVDGLPIVGSNKVPDKAFIEVRRLAKKMFEKIPKAHEAMIKNKVRIAIMADTEVTLDIPEHNFLKNDKNTDWNKRARGLGATKRVPVISCAEENVLAYPSDRYRGESIFIHEFSHAIMGTGLADSVKGFSAEIRSLYRKAMEEGLWEKTYAATDAGEYWAEGVQSWFNTNTESIPANGVHNHVNTRKELYAYDPRLAKFIARFMPTDDWRYVPPDPKWKRG